jgi:hypothetical protein
MYRSSTEPPTVTIEKREKGRMRVSMARIKEITLGISGLSALFGSVFLCLWIIVSAGTGVDSRASAVLRTITAYVYAPLVVALVFAAISGVFEMTRELVRIILGKGSL